MIPLIIFEREIIKGNRKEGTLLSAVGEVLFHICLFNSIGFLYRYPGVNIGKLKCYIFCLIWNISNYRLEPFFIFIMIYIEISFQKPVSTVRFFNRTDYYTVHGDDTSIVAEFLSTSAKYMGSIPKLSYICLNKAQFESILRELLLIRQYRVEIYVKTSSKNNNDWDLEYRASPGNLTQVEDLLFENANVDFTNSVMGIKIIQNKVNYKFVIIMLFT